MADDDLTADPLRAALRGPDQESLRVASEAQVALSLRRLLDDHAAQYPDDDVDELTGAGWILRLAEQWSASAVAVCWLAERPSHARLALVLAVLMVFWNCSPGQPLLALPVEALLSVYDDLPYDVESEKGLAVALISASRSGLPEPLAARVRMILAQTRARPGQFQVLRKMIDAVLNTQR